VDYTSWLKATGKRPTAAAALEWLQTIAPPGTKIPESFQGSFGGATATPAPAAAAPAPAAPAAPVAAPAPLPTPVNPYLPQMGQVVQQMGTLPAHFNPQRQGLAAQFAASMGNYYDQPLGLSDYTTPTATDASGNTQYGIVQGPQGYAYREAGGDIAHNFASRGVASGSQIDQAKAQAERALNMQAAKAWADYTAGQQGINANQMGAYGTLQGTWADLIGKGNAPVNEQIAGMGAPPQTTGVQIGSQGTVPVPSPENPLRTLTGGVSPQRLAGTQTRPVKAGTRLAGVKPQVMKATAAVPTGGQAKPWLKAWKAGR
jgi:hypothetical protein